LLRVQSSLGIFLILSIAFLLSEDKRKINIRVLVAGVILQILLAFILIKIPVSQALFLALNRMVEALEEATKAGTSFVFGYLGGGPLPFKSDYPQFIYIFAFRGLPLVLVISAISSLLFYWNILPLIVRVFSKIFQTTMKIGGVEAFGCSMNIFVGMIESPLFVRPYLSSISKSELFTIMTCGMATIAGTVMVLYATILKPVIPHAMGHLLIASIISAPASIVISKIMLPETQTFSTADIKIEQRAKSSMDAITRGTIDGINLLINIVAMLIVLVALVHLLNMILSILPNLGGKPITFQRIVGIIMAPVVWMMGVPWKEATIGGALMGTKTVLNELIAYMDLANLPKGSLSLRSSLILTYAMCGFANFGSLGIMIGGLGSLIPERRSEVVSLGIRSIIAGTLSTCMTGAIIGIIL